MQNKQVDIWQLYAKESNLDNKRRIKEDIIVKYLDLVKIVASKLFNYYAKKIEYDDLVGYGIIGLIDAIDKFDIEKNIKFETYASIRIRGSIMDEIRNQDWVSRTARKKIKELNTASDELCEKLGREATKKEIAEYIKVSVEEYDELILQTSTYNIVSIEEELFDDFKLQIIDNKIENSPEGSLLHNDAVENLTRALDKLKDKEKLIISLYYYESLTYKEIASIVGLSESRISQIISECLSKLKKMLQ